jgi:hypothetical protein
MGRKGWFHRWLVGLLIGVGVACGVSPTVSPRSIPMVRSPVPTRSPTAPSGPMISPIPSACGPAEATPGSPEQVDPTGWHWETMPSPGASLRRLAPGTNLPLIPAGQSGEGRFLDLWASVWYSQGGRSVRLTVDLEEGSHRRWPEIFPFSLAPDFLRDYAPRHLPDRSPKGSWIAATATGRVVTWRPGEPAKDLHAPKPMRWAGWGDGEMILALDEAGQVWRGTAEGRRWEPVVDATGHSLYADQIAVGPESPWAVAFQFQSRFVPPTPTPRPPRAEPPGRTSQSPRRTPAAPQDVPEEVALWRVPLRWGTPAEGPTRYQRVVIGSDMPLRGSTLLPGGQWVLDDFPVLFPGSPFGSLGQMVEISSGRILNGEALGWPVGETPGDWDLSPDGRWVAAAIIERATGRRIGIWVSPAAGFPKSAGWRFPGWEGLWPAGWHPAGKGVLVWQGERVGWLPLPPDPEGVRALKGLAPWPLGWWEENVLGVAQGQPAKVIAIDRHGRRRELLDLSPWIREVVWIEATGDRLFVVGARKEAEGCAYQLFEWRPREP